MKNKQQIFDMLDRFMETEIRNDLDSARIGGICLAFDWVLDRVDTDDIVSELTTPSSSFVGLRTCD